MAELTNDLIESIIKRLPVKSILRFRCVSKHFRALIDTNSFVKNHLNRSIQTKTNKKLVFESVSDLFSVDLYSLNQAVKTVHPLKAKQPVNTLLGSCNGLLCVMYANPIVIWNPATRKHLKLPTIRSSLLDEDVGIERFILAHGFGYDSVSDNYKVVLLIQFLFLEDCSFDTETQVYSLRFGSWIIIEDFPDYLIRDKQVPGALACGALHWIAGKLNEHDDTGCVDHFIAAFNLVTEKHFKVTLPDLHPDEIPGLLVSELGGCLSVVCSYFVAGVVDVWVMKDYGVRESWTKLVTFSDPGVVVGIIDGMNPLAYSESGDEVLLMVSSEKLVLYNLEKKTFRFVHVRGLSKFFHAKVYFESLVSLGKKARDDEKQRARKEQKGKFLSVGFKLVL